MGKVFKNSSYSNYEDQNNRLIIKKTDLNIQVGLVTMQICYRERIAINATPKTAIAAIQ